MARYLTAKVSFKSVEMRSPSFDDLIICKSGSHVPKTFLAMLTIELRLVNWTRLTVIDSACLCNIFYTKVGSCILNNKKFHNFDICTEYAHI